MHSIELTLDDAAEEAVRARWQALGEAGLPSLALHTSPTNRPHVTLAAAPSLTPVAPEAPLPASVRFSGTMLFPAHNDRWVLVDAIVVDAALASFHRALHELVGPALPTSLPDQWTPHITLSRRLPSDRIAAALEALRSAPLPETAAIAGLRYWDGDARAVTRLG